MESSDAVLIALLIILVVVVMYYGSKKKHHSHCDKFTHHPMYNSGLSHNHKHRSSTPVAYVAPRRREKYSRSNEHFDPERVAEALRAIEGIPEGGDDMSVGGTKRDVLSRRLPRSQNISLN